MRWLYTVLIFLLLLSCKSQQPQPPIITQDSMRVETRIERVFVPDTVYIELPQQTSEVTTQDTISVLELDYAKSTARINNDGTLYHRIEMKPTTIEKEVQTQIIYRDSVIENEKCVQVPTPYPVEVEKPLSKWQKIMITGFWLFLVSLLISLSWKYRKSLGKIFRV